jgi:hypothetical protein
MATKKPNKDGIGKAEPVLEGAFGPLSRSELRSLRSVWELPDLASKLSRFTNICRVLPRGSARAGLDTLQEKQCQYLPSVGQLRMRPGTIESAAIEGPWSH